MVDFNPDAQLGAQPDDTRGYHTIEQPKPNESLGTVLTTAAKVFEGANKVYQTGMENKLTSDIEDIRDKQLDPYISSLEQVRDQVATGKADLGWQNKYDSLLPEDSTQQPPENLQTGLSNIDKIGTARAQGAGGRANDTLYTGALYAEAKKLKSAHPGWSDYIDDQIKHVTGMDPANAYYRNLLEDINQGLAQKNTVTNSILSSLRSAADSGFHDSNGVTAADVHHLVSTGQMDPEKGLKWLNSAKSLEYDWKIKSERLTAKQADQADARMDADKELGTMAQKEATHAWMTMTLTKGTDTPQKLDEFLSYKAAHPDSDERSQAIGEQMVAMRRQLANEITRKAIAGGFLEKYGGDMKAIDDKVNASLLHFDRAIKDVFNNDWGSAYSNAHFNKAISEDTTNKMYNAPDEESRRYNRAVGAVSKISPQFAKDFFQTAVIGNVPDSDKDFVNHMEMGMLAQPDGRYGHLTSIQDAINQAKAKGVSSPKSYDQMISFIDNISNPKIAESQRLNLAISFFDPQKNGALLSDQNFQKDYIDPKTGRNVPGKYSFFQRMSSENVAQGVAELSKKYPEIGNMYRETMEKQFGEYLWSSEINGIGEDFRKGGFKLKYTTEPGQPPRFSIVDQKNMPLVMRLKETVQEDRLINRLNGGIAGMYNVYKNTGDPNPEQTILNTMWHYTDPANRGGPSSGMFWQSVGASQIAKKKAEEDKKKEKNASRPE